MNFTQFISSVSTKCPVGTVLYNPGGGTSTIKSITSNNICYERGNSSITAALLDLFNAYSNYKRKQVSCSDLKKYSPSVFDSKAITPGHDCNCTFLFLVLKEIGIIQSIIGAGVRGNPYCINIP
ncbi:MAG: hypothetical protein U9N77_11200 [Thermodesulfobacteriota bacterium]|nr:hypothetical protein [Thermodesulfobacteriota bacterium]